MKTNGKDPLNFIVCGVGGQGNVLMSRFLARAFVKKGYQVAIGETFGASQRGGAVMSHLRISKKRLYSPLIPEGDGHIVVGLEPMETMRILGRYGNPDIAVISNTRPVYPMSTITGEAKYPGIEELKKAITELSASQWFLDATQISLDMGNPILANMIILGALVQTEVVDLSKADMEEIIRETFPEKIAKTNIEALSRGMQAISK